MPGYFLQEQGLCDTRISGLGGSVEHDHIEWADILIFQRICEPKNEAWHYATEKGKRIISENDDYYEKVPAGSRAKSFFPASVLKGINNTLRLSDRLTVTTQKLADVYGKHGIPVDVIPNALDMRIDHWYPSVLKNIGTVVIGYQGSATHSVDFNAAIQALDDIMERYPFVRVHALGWFPPKFLDKYPTRTLLKGWQPLHTYFNAIRDLGTHVGLAPIDDIEFNHAKSNLKCIEYATIRTPWIASKVGPYINITNKSGGGLLVKNKYSSWYKALEKMVTMSHSQRQEMGEKGRAYVEQHYDIKKIAKLWEKAILKTLDIPVNPKRIKLFANMMSNRKKDLTFKQIV